MVNEAVTQALIEELQREDAAIVTTWEQFRVAQVRHQIQVHRYAAIRDLILERLGGSPYTEGWKWGLADLPSQGRFRFVNMTPGVAVVAALREASEPMTMDELVVKLRNGGGSPFPRAVNAALMQTKGIVRSEEGENVKYRYVEPDPDDVPFDN